MNRNYSPQTLKILFGMSRNQCAHPNCINTLIEPNTENSDACVIAHICHIHAISPDGPRFNPNLVQKELNSNDNLILLCRNHHAVVDGQPETYTAEMLKKWKQSHESKISQNHISARLENFALDTFSRPNFPTALVDAKIEDEIKILRKSRFFVEFDRIRPSLTLGKRIVEGDLSGGTNTVKCRALAWCARLLCRSDKQDKAVENLQFAESLGNCPEIEIAGAFIASQIGDMSAALNVLAGIDSPCSRSAALIIVAHHLGAKGALDWMSDANIDATDLDSEGKFFLLNYQLELARWDTAKEITNILTDQNFEEMPVLHRMKALIQLLTTVPGELRAVVLNQLPFNAAEFALASNEVAMNARREAQCHFAESAEAAYQLNCPKAATQDDEYALWLELMDPEFFENGRRRLQEKLCDTKLVLRFVPLALQFGIKLDLATIGQEIERQIALNGGITQDAATSRFAMAFVQESPADIANYITKHYDELSEFIDKNAMRFIQIEAFARAGLSKKAYEILENLIKDGLSEIEESRMHRIISEVEGTNPKDAWEAQFKESDSLGDLVALVEQLESRQNWDALCEYGALLFDRTHNVRNAERLSNALNNSHRSERLIQFVEDNLELLSLSNHLQVLYSCALFQEGLLVESRTQFAQLGEDPENRIYRALQINLGIALGDWNSLSAFVASEYQRIERRSAYELMDTAKLAVHISSPLARDLIYAAADSSDDAGVLANAYFLATYAGWENDEQVSQWLSKAAELSGDDGPLQRISLKSFFDKKPEWDRWESETLRLLHSGEIPMFLAAERRNRSLIDLMTIPAIVNLSQNDPRRKSTIPTYSGDRLSIQFDPGSTTVGMDVTALLTLNSLDLLEKVLDAFKTVWVPHSTLVWLFEEKQKCTFHQPSRIKGAHQIRDFLATNALEEFVPRTVADDELAVQVGDELALFITEAEMVRNDVETQHIVVQSSPVYRLSSFMEEEVDLTEHAHVLSSCIAVVNMLRQKAQITAEEEKRACAYLSLHEKPWPHQPVITDGAVLYLDHLAITYFLHLRMLGKLKTAGFRPIVLPRTISETNALIAYESIADNVMQAIEQIRSAVSSRINSGVIRVGKRHKAIELDEQLISVHPSFEVIELARNCDSIITDDRFLNQNSCIDDSSTQTSIFSTLDLLDSLTNTGVISSDNRLEHRTRLRRAGYIFVPVSADELAQHLSASEVKNNQVIETTELKAIRENILQVRMSDWLQLPKEYAWLDTTLKSFIFVLKNLWKDGADISSASVRSNWLVDQIDIRGWSHRYEPDNGNNMLKIGRGKYILMLFSVPVGATPEGKDAYWEWLEDQILVSIKEQFPDLYAQIVEWYRKRIAEIADMELPEQGMT